MTDEQRPATKRSRYPWCGLYTLPPDPRRKSANAVIVGQRKRYAALEVVCCNGCAEKGRSRPDGGCRHTDLLIGRMKPWWRSRARARQTVTSTAQGGAS